MKKTIFVVALSIAGFIAVWRFEPGPVHNTAAVAQAPPSTSAPSTSAGPSTSVSPDATVTTQGTAESGRYGTVQVQVTFTGARLAVITLLQAPDSGRSLTALPRLQEEAIKAQSADIDTVTGATETSESYKTSLQAAIDARGTR